MSVNLQKGQKVDLTKGNTGFVLSSLLPEMNGSRVT